jgi:lambda family phage portal protein
VAKRSLEQLNVSWFDRFLISIAPKWGLERVRARATVRYFEAAQGGRRSSGWMKSATDANAANRPALTALRELARDLRRNNGWAKRGVQVITNNTVGWGIMPTPDDANRKRSEAAIKLWNAWAKSTACDFDGRQNFYGLQRLAMDTIVEAGEVLIVRQAPLNANQPIPLRIQVLEPDYIDTSRSGVSTAEGNSIVDGIEFDQRGQRVAYWLFTQHPGSNRLFTSRFESARVPAERVLHIYRLDRPGQSRGVSWLAAAITRLKDLDDYEDAELMQQKVAACFSAFVTDEDQAAPRSVTRTTPTPNSSTSSRATSPICRQVARSLSRRRRARRTARSRSAFFVESR